MPWSHALVVCMLESGRSAFYGKVVIGNELKAYQEAFRFRKIILIMLVVKEGGTSGSVNSF